MALIFLLHRLSKEWSLKLHIAHLDHGLRKDSPDDRKFVENLAKKLNLPVTSARIDIKKIAKKGSLEEICRNARLGFFFNIARSIKTKKVALGHNLDDQAETVLMRLLRGSGLYGLSGMLPKKTIAQFQIIRPLIEVRRKEIERFLKKKKIRPRRDDSNRENIYFRNKIRNCLLPLLERGYNRNIKEILSNTAQSISYDYDYLNHAALKITRRLGKKINLRKFLKLHPAMQRLVLRCNIARLKGNTRRLTYQHIKEVEDLLLNRPVNSVVDLPRGISLRKGKNHLYCYCR